MWVAMYGLLLIYTTSPHPIAPLMTWSDFLHCYLIALTAVSAGSLIYLLQLLVRKP
jgi:hypothetical protein